MEDFSQSISLKPRSQSVCGSWSQSQSGAGGSYWTAPVTAAQTSLLAVEALVRLSAMTLARQLSLGMCLVKIRHSRKQATRWRARIRVEAVMSPLTERFSQPKTTLVLSTPRMTLLPWTTWGASSGTWGSGAIRPWWNLTSSCSRGGFEGPYHESVLDPFFRVSVKSAPS